MGCHSVLRENSLSGYAGKKNFLFPSGDGGNCNLSGLADERIRINA
ncbi:hypothetical protein GDI2762 [Gluconacetobacter diazotrophicus PA1 5]|uniref:Uncharacterized protein n=1 Tax=Gluconacetobacter diazotrophicus (strain ATCC 49037 / DSM 5601 / CCUG 37298 / CIP 103539 / LMG 7603 / PAl5) TaxID=272568 RepID=A9HQA7_GLUDA|nr:hypothetical protein GDI2762 [Gluconacetobacter diazotrophicus PA1 5]